MDKKFNIKNYTTEISAERSIAEIEKLLASFGTTEIRKEYLGDGRIHALSFKIEGDVFKLPANVNGVKHIMFKDKRDSSRRDVMRNRDIRAYNVAWRVIKDWVHAQLSLIFSNQAPPKQLFFGHMYDGKRTMYQFYLEEKALPQHKKKEDK